MFNYLYFGLLILGGVLVMGVAAWGLMKETGSLKQDASVPDALLDMTVFGLFRHRGDYEDPYEDPYEGV
jgi:hypothetical protein